MEINPKSIALIGASHKKGKVGNAIARNLLMFKNSFFVNPNMKEILGKKCYKSILEIPTYIETAVIAIKPEFIADVMEECGRKKVKDAIIITAGFGEIGAAGEIMERRILEIARKHNIRLLGPNCFGIINPYGGLNATFASIPVKQGKIAFLSQSGALCSAVLDIALQRNIGFSFFASVGNMADIDFSDLMEELNKDEKTKVIAIYMEALKPESGRRFLEIAGKCKKPIIILKSGVSKAGAKTALTHTGSIASNYEIYREAFREAGIIEAKSLTEAIDKALFLPDKKFSIKNGIVILSNAGGPAVLSADYCEELNVKIAEIPSQIISNLDKVLPKTWNKSNPMDIIGDADAQRYKSALENLNFDYDCLVCILTPQEMSQPAETAKELIKFSKKTKKPVVAAFLGGKRISAAESLLNKNSILCFSELKRAIELISF